MSNEIVTGSFQMMKSLNRSIILNTIRRKGPISRAEIAKKTKLTPPTVSNIVKELLESRIVMESNQGESKGGRKPTMLIINAKSYYIIGLDVGPRNLRVVLTDLNANLLDSSEQGIPDEITNDKLLALMKDSISTILAKAHIDQEKMIGIGIGMHGMVDVEKGVSLFAPNLHLRDIPIKEYLEREFKMVVRVENDARAMALGESWFGSGIGADSVVCVNVGRGVGAGIIINGRLYHGENFIGGEIGHMTIDIDGPKCSCGNYGCLQTMAAGPVIPERASKEIAMGRKSILNDMVDGQLENLSGALVYKAAKKGDALATEILAQTGRYLGVGLTNLIHTLNPKQIIVGGGVSKSEHFILDSVKETIQQRALTIAAKKTEVNLSELEDNATAIGAVTLLLVELFSSNTAQ